MKLRIVSISDTHGFHRELSIPDGDILIHAGDCTKHGKLEELIELNQFFGSLPHRYKILIAGNHDWCFESQPLQARSMLTNCRYLQDEAITLEGVKFYGSPWQPWFFDWAFNLKRGAEIKRKWDLIPADTQVLITHGPPYGFCDETSNGNLAGCEELLEAVQRIEPRLHIFGHIHEGAGIRANERTTFVNASSCNLEYEPVNPPIVSEIKIE